MEPSASDALRSVQILCVWTARYESISFLLSYRIDDTRTPQYWRPVMLVRSRSVDQRIEKQCLRLKDDRQRFLQKVSKNQFRTVYYNANACG